MLNTKITRQNVTVRSESETANTNGNSANQRAENLAVLGSKKILELCVGPSLQRLELAYNKFGMDVTGNDLEFKWQRYYPDGKWVIGDALKVDIKPYDTVIFAPPLSTGCTGRREDSLFIEQVNPGYYSFLDKVSKEGYDGLIVLVLPARSLSTATDREQYYRLLSHLNSIGFSVEQVPLTDGSSRQIRKYVDLYCKKQN